MTSRSTPVVVVGAGVIGLSVAVRLAERGREVQVLAADLPAETTSAVAAAIWYPYRIEPVERVRDWSLRSLAEFERLAADQSTGVVLRSGTEVLRAETADPWWATLVPSLRRLVEVPAGYLSGWSFDTPVVEMPAYLGWLSRRLTEHGVVVHRRRLAELPAAAVVVNCAGLGARDLVGDDQVHPVRGQVVTVSQIGLDRWWLDGSGLTYVVPRSDDIVLGGTDVEGSWDLRPDAVVAAAILARATALVPALADAEVRSHRVGLRPARSAVRLEVERRPSRRCVVHCYGHGGAGVTVSWGCADEVLALLDQVEEDGR